MSSAFWIFELTVWFGTWNMLILCVWWTYCEVTSICPANNRVVPNKFDVPLEENFADAGGNFPSGERELINEE